MKASNKDVVNKEKHEDELRIKIKTFFLATESIREKGVCPTRDIMAKLTDKWSLLCLYNLGYHKNLRYNKLKKYIPDISSRMLSYTLKRLEKEGLIKREAFAEVPPRVVYSISPYGAQMAEKMIDLNTWIFNEEKTRSKDRVNLS